MAERPRLTSVDLLRGAVMVIMALDHTREFIDRSAQAFRPEDLSQTTHLIFFTRWITHFCAPVFAFTTGLGAFLRLERGGGSPRTLSWFLVTRGLWLVLLEVTVVRVGFFFNVDYSVVIMLVFWMLGLSMVALALLIHLPFRVLLAVSLGMIVFHNLFDTIRPADLGSAGWLWNILHVPGGFPAAGRIVVIGYPLIPWIGVVGAGYCLGRVYRLPPEQRSRWLVRLGIALTVAFVVVRAINIYGDRFPWSWQPRPGFTLLSFLNTSKYPPSLDFLLMTLGPAIAFLGWMDRVRVKDANPIVVFGRTPMFYFVVHIPLIHLIAVGMTWLRYGATSFLFLPPPTLGTDRKLFPPDYGWDLWVTYAIWLLVVALMYPMCLWLARLKQRKRAWWLSYL
jgi:uncharacterized membrane protein